ncbi:MAG: phosphoribosylanthranilate isomerase [Kiritimatiellae bacterium]|nr:phosphoribosylanthranilate isomerase [Kiritimatiellia bacterium]
MIEIKICGLTTLADAAHALGCGADYLGFVLYSRSPRCIGPGALRVIAERLKGQGGRLVGVFVNESPARVREIADECRLDAVQIHGDEKPDGYAEVGVPVWRAVRLADAGPEPRPEAWPAERYVVDPAPRGVYGGAGVTADWQAASDFSGRFPTMLAGGLTPANVEEAIRRVQPLGVDVSSGVERDPGRKDHAKVKEFIASCRRVCEETNAR